MEQRRGIDRREPGASTGPRAVSADEQQGAPAPADVAGSTRTGSAPAQSAPASRWRDGWRRFAVVAAILGTIAGVVTAASAALHDERAPAVKTVAVERGDLETTVTALGAVKPKDSVEVGTQVSGQLMRVHVEIGDRVGEGDLLAEIAPKVYASQVRSSEANLEKLEAQLAQRRAEAKLARQQLDRSRKLHAQSAVSLESVEQNEASLAVADALVQSLRAEIRSAQSTLERDRTSLGYTKIYAPMSGTVVAEGALAGQTVNASQSAPMIVEVANLDTMTVWAQVAEADIAKIQVGMPSYFTTLGTPDRRIAGVVRQVQPTPEIENDVVLYNVLIDVDNTEHALMSEMTVQVFFVTHEARDVVLAPLSALRKTGRGYTATVVRDGKREEREVAVVATTRTVAEIGGGLEPGDQLVVEAASGFGGGSGPGGGSASGRRPRVPGGGPQL